ncbi:RNA/RNP complex-1-interacting phosphatase isoform X2 [Conger conger]|nr:RNA/RNP complex-1-interacting phosphatase isoform X2 [Conger conger]
MDYQALGKRIPGTRFIAFKVPLKQSLRKCFPSSEAFGPFELVHQLEEEKEELGLIIDLTFTTRYYSPMDLPDSVHYLKIFTTGHQVPSDPTILSFKKAVYRFLQENENNDKVIGVHCTHGLNRTGYLVCRYLIDVEGIVPSEAVALFNRSRGHPIERQNYLHDLLSGPQRSNTGIEEPDQDPIRGSAGCSQDGPPVCRCSPFNKSLHQSQSFSGAPTHPPLLPHELTPCGQEQALRRPPQRRPPPCRSGAEHNPSGGVALSSCLQGPQEKPQSAPGKPHKKRNKKNKGNRS